MKRKLMILATAFGVLVSGCSREPANTVEQYVRAYNLHDVQAIGRLLADDVRFTIAGAQNLVGKEAVLEVARYDSALGIFMRIKNVEKSDHELICDLTESNDWLREAGLPYAEYRVRFICRDDRIARIEAEMKPATRAFFAERVDRFFNWVKENRPEEYGFLMQGDRFRFHRENGPLMLSLVRAWKEYDR